MNWPSFFPCPLIKKWIKGHGKSGMPKEEFNGELKQSQQIIESSQRRLQRATHNGVISKRVLDESHERLKNNLDEMAAKLRKLREKGVKE